jgi:outer membrane assembly lipoprotein YfgL
MNRKPSMKRLLSIGTLAISLGLLGGCSLFGKDKDKPAVLEAGIPSTGAVRLAWSSKGDSVNFPLGIATTGDRFVVAGDDGSLHALNATDGREAWRAQAGSKLTAGVGSDGRFAAVVNRDNQVITFDGGKRLWAKALPTPVVAPPLVAGERVFVLTIDRQVLAFDALDGRKIWEYRRAGDALTLAKPGVLVAFKDTLVAGQGARLVGLDPVSGQLRWEATVAQPRGTNEVERLADLVGPALRVGDLICARAFQFAVGCVNAERGSSLWNRNAGGTQGVGGDAQIIVGADASDRISAWKLSNGDLAWSADQFIRRRLVEPVVIGKQVLVADYEGQVHVLDRETGKTVQRVATDGSPAVAAARVGTTALIATRNGGVFAFQAAQ